MAFKITIDEVNKKIGVDVGTRMILERTGDSRWYMKHVGLCASVDEWWPVLSYYLDVFDVRV
jgi:hypothetical protein